MYSYALQLLTPASILAKLGGRSGEITLADVSETDELFLDARGSARMLQQQQQGLGEDAPGNQYMR